MNTTITRGMLVACVLLFQAHVSAQDREWKTATSKDGKVTAKYYFGTRVNEEGDKVPEINAVTIATVDMDIGNCISLMKNVSKHKEFRGEKSSELIKTISENAWVIYYYNDKTLVTPAVDGAYLMEYENNPGGKQAIFRIIADPALTEKTGATRMTYAREVYTFQELENGQLEVTIKTTTSLGFKVSFFFLKRAFPGKLFDTMERFITCARMEKP